MLIRRTKCARAGDAARWWPEVAELLTGLAGDREAAMPKACSWVLRSWLAPCPGEVAAGVMPGRRLTATLANRSCHFCRVATKVRRHEWAS